IAGGTKGAASRTVGLRNDGEATLQIGEISLAGADPDDFKLIRNCAYSAIQPGQECRLNLIFMPQVRAGRANQDRFCSAILVVRHNAGGGQGEALLSGAAKRAVSMPKFDLTPKQWDFGRSQVGARGQAQSFTLINLGEEPFWIGPVIINEKFPGNFMIVDNRCNVTLNPGNKCDVVVRFIPRSGCKMLATLQIPVGKLFATASLSSAGVVE